MLIDNAVKYVTSHGLRFNPMKTSCLIKGGCPFPDNPIWYIDENRLLVEDQTTLVLQSVANPVTYKLKNAQEPAEELFTVYKVLDCVRMVYNQI